MWEEPKQLIADNLDEFLDYFEVDYRKYKNTYQCVCPFHEDAQKMGGYVIYKNSNHTVHLCLTECPKNTRKDGVTFIHKLLNRSTVTSYEEAIKFVYEFLNEEFTDEWKVKGEKNSEKDVFTAAFADSDEVIRKEYNISREQIRAKLLIPATYYLNRGFSADILNDYDVGLCINKTSKYYGRVIIPCYNESGDKYIGCTARSVYERCEKCKHHHDPAKWCPTSDYDKWKTKKWLHDNISPRETVFNIWKSQNEIRKTRKAILCEGPGDCIKLASLGVTNSLAVFGNSLKEGQIQLLDSLGVMDLIVLLDNDKAGLAMGQQIKEDCGKFYRLYFPKLKGVKDAGDLQTDKETEDIKALLAKLGV